MALVFSMRDRKLSVRRDAMSGNESGAIALTSTLSLVALIVAIIADITTPFIGIVGYALTLFIAGKMISWQQTARDATVTLLVGFALYSILPIFAGNWDNSLLRAFGKEGGLAIHNFAAAGLLAGVALSMALQKYIVTQAPYRYRGFTDPVAGQVSMLISAISIALSALWAVQYGLVIGGNVDYMDSFLDRRSTGVGLFLLSVPLAFVGLALAIGKSRRVLTLPVAVAIASFAMLFLVQGQRKYIVAPLMLIALARLPLRKGYHLAILLALATPIWFLFSYLGYLRIENIPIWQAFAPEVTAAYGKSDSSQLFGETPAVLAIASAAKSGFVRALPDAGDYLSMWQMAVPQFLIDSTYQPANIRFAYQWNPRTAAAGQGWGFDFWGEAYLVGGYALTVGMGALAAFFFRLPFLLSQGTDRFRIWLTLSLIAPYYALWLQRNALAYIVREYVTFVGGAVLLAVAIGAVATRIASAAANARQSARPFMRPVENA